MVKNNRQLKIVQDGSNRVGSEFRVNFGSGRVGSEFYVNFGSGRVGSLHLWIGLGRVKKTEPTSNSVIHCVRLTVYLCFNYEAEISIYFFLTIFFVPKLLFFSHTVSKRKGG